MSNQPYGCGIAARRAPSIARCTLVAEAYGVCRGLRECVWMDEEQYTYVDARTAIRLLPSSAWWGASSVRGWR